MPPELKKTIASISEMTCENCVFSHNRDKDMVECCNQDTSDWQRDDDEFCSKGTWRLVVAQNRVSLGCFEVCYDYLTEAE